MRLFFFFLSCFIISLNLWADAGSTFPENFKEENFDKVVTHLGDKTSLTLMFTGTFSTLIAQQHDVDVRNTWVNHQRMSESAAHVGDLLGSGLGGAVILGGQYLFDSKRENWQSHTRALVWQTAVVGIAKYSTGVQRPGNKNRYESFPSGHTATSFATATSLAYAYGWKVGMIAYPVATFVGLSRLSDDMHWASDVVAGAFVGIIMGRATSSEYESHQSNLSWTPVLGPEFSGLNLMYSF